MSKFKKKGKKPDTGGVKKRPTILKRKLERAEKRKAKKVSKAEFMVKKFKKAETAEEKEAALELKRMKKEQNRLDQEKQKARHVKRLAKEQRKQRNQQLLLANQEEEKNIKKLEKQLGLKKRKSKNLPKSFQEDGLDYLLGPTGAVTFEGIEESEDEMGGKSEDDNDDDDPIASAMLSSDEENDHEDDEQAKDEEMEEEGEESGDEEIEDNHTEEEEDEDENDDQGEEEVEDEEGGGGGEWEDIYGRKRSKDGGIIKNTDSANTQTGNGESAVSAGGKYIPPAMRKAAAAMDKKKELERLAKQLKGNLNRLAESNMHSIAVQIENMYSSNSRNDMNQTLYNLIYLATVSPVLTPERLVMEYIMLITILHANIGSEVGAHFIEEFVRAFNNKYSSTDLTGESGKELDNIILLLSYIFNFRMISSKFLFEILNKLADSFKTKDIELILIALRSAGFILRKDDPLEMKNLILKIQNKATVSTGGEDNSRVQFMLDVLLAVKNNNVNKIPNYDPSHLDHLRKGLKSHIREGNFVTELKIGLKDLEDADTKGRWWIVGSFYAGNLVGEKRGGAEEPQGGDQGKKKEEFSTQLLQLAKKMRMNTEQRKNIFCLIMSSEDYIEATERLIKLGTKNQMERDVMFVLLDSAMQEKVFNPFYSQVAIKLSSMDRKYKISNQFSIWDKMKQSRELKSGQLINLAKYISHLIRERSQSISVLRVIEFSEMTKPNVHLLRTILCEVLLMENLEDMENIFQAVSESPNLKLYREGLRLFLRHFLLKKSKLDPSIPFHTLEERVKTAESCLSTPGSKLKL
ncbi:nucleolar MIF4G domain-containing protein 1 [Eurytemora carolleeae]|uniref:nucleolar MIF4G domain-containing protein 1 n=1 Tax=Eurytemora carolleeae TaxID=1294199 RepID=UPI000C75AC49|nr:nucleolar MIF4G domain-containing protein 1 [Eurytemora carolleeae]|eukprot:XP_023321469.1 nucleolar MIF4G domain-containing protein 1-like [Eurytemora affinis]